MRTPIHANCPEEIFSSDEYLRCPKCKHIQDAHEATEAGGGAWEGPRDIKCEACGHEYEIIIYINYVYESPLDIDCQGKEQSDD